MITFLSEFIQQVVRFTIRKNSYTMPWLSST